MDALVMAGQLILGLSILVGLHELGHLLTAKLFGMRVEQYSIGFPPKIFGFKMGETEYSLGAIPLGGYVKITGMIDESLDTEYLGREPQPYEFRAKPAWQRLIVMMGGIIVNVLTGILIFIILLYTYGKSYLPVSEARYGIVAEELAQEIGLRTGDRILEINGKTYDDFYDVRSPDVLLNSDSYYTVERDGKRIRIQLPNNLIEQLSDKNEPKPFISPIAPFEVARVAAGTEAEKMRLKPGDRITRINGKPVQFFHEVRQAVLGSKGKQVQLEVVRNGKTLELNGTVPASGEYAGQLGFAPRLLLKEATIDYTLGRAVQEGPKMAFSVVRDNIRAFGKIFRGEVSASKSLSGPIGIAQIYGSTWNWERFWSLTALLSMILAFMNFLPIPALDGGHVMFLTYEIVSGRSPSTRFLEVAQKVGMVILLSLMVFAFFNDIFKNFFS